MLFDSFISKDALLNEKEATGSGQIETVKLNQK
jgi:hypothetical protein